MIHRLGGSRPYVFVSSLVAGDPPSFSFQPGGEGLKPTENVAWVLPVDVWKPFLKALCLPGRGATG